MTHQSEKQLKSDLILWQKITDEILALCAAMGDDVTTFDIQIGLSRALITALKANGLSDIQVANHFTDMARDQPFITRIN